MKKTNKKLQESIQQLKEQQEELKDKAEVAEEEYQKIKTQLESNQFLIDNMSMYRNSAIGMRKESQNQKSITDSRRLKNEIEELHFNEMNTSYREVMVEDCDIHDRSLMEEDHR